MYNVLIERGCAIDSKMFTTFTTALYRMVSALHLQYGVSSNSNKPVF